MNKELKKIIELENKIIQYKIAISSQPLLDIELVKKLLLKDYTK